MYGDIYLTAQDNSATFVSIVGIAEIQTDKMELFKLHKMVSNIDCSACYCDDREKIVS